MRAIELVWPGKGQADDGYRADASAIELTERLEPERDELEPQALLPLPSDGASGWRNLLVCGDNLSALQALGERLREPIDLVYIDPPFATGLSYYSQADLGEGDALERRAYRDRREDGMAGYLDAMLRRLRLMRELLGDHGKMFLHCDWRASSMLRLLLDEVFGAECFRNEIIWRRAPNLGRQAASRQLGRVFDNLYVYSKTPGSAFAGPPPRRSAEVPLDRNGKPRGARWDEVRKAFFTTAPRGDYTDTSIARLREEGRVFESATGTIYIKYFLRQDGARWFKDQPCDALWDDFEVRPLRHRPKSEDMGYDTQKPEGLLERILRWSTKPGDLVADFYCGSGTTPAVAESLGRRWIACDAGHAAVQVTRQRLLERRVDDDGGVRRARPFDVLSVRRADRRRWAARVQTGEVERVLSLFGAEPSGGRFGRRGSARVWLAPIDQAPEESSIEALCAEHAGAAPGTPLELLAWTWPSWDAAALRRRMRERHGVELRLFTVPDDALDGSATRRAVTFRERSELELELREDAGRVSIALARLSNAEGRDMRELCEAWAVDWHYHGDFCADWWSHRRAAQGFVRETPWRRRCAGTIRVRVVTVLGEEIVRDFSAP